MLVAQKVGSTFFVLLVCFHTRKLLTWAETCPFINSGVQTLDVQ